MQDPEKHPWVEINPDSPALSQTAEGKVAQRLGFRGSERVWRLLWMSWSIRQRYILRASLKTNFHAFTILLRETPGNRRCPMDSANQTLCLLRSCRPCHPAPAASPSWNQEAATNTGAWDGDHLWLGLSPTRCIHWKICTTRQGTPPRLRTPSLRSWPCQMTSHPRWCPSPQRRGQTPLPFTILHLGQKKMVAWPGALTNAGEPTETAGQGTSAFWWKLDSMSTDSSRCASSIRTGFWV